MDDSASAGGRQVADLDLESQAPSSIPPQSSTNMTNPVGHMKSWSANEELSAGSAVLQRESDSAFIVASQTESGTGPVGGEQTQFGIASIPNEQSNYDNVPTDQQAGSDIVPIAGDRKGSCTALTKDEQLTFDKAPLPDGKPIETDRLLSADEQMESDTGPIAVDQTKFSTTNIADDRLKCDKAPFADNLMECDKPHAAGGEAELDAAPIKDEEMETDKPLVADYQMESGIPLVADDQIESVKPHFADDQMESDKLHVADDQMESDKPLAADDQMESDKSHVADDQTESYKPHVADDQMESYKPHVADDQMESDKPLVADDQMESDKSLDADDQMESDKSLDADDQMVSDKPHVGEEAELDAPPIEDEQMECGKSLTTDEQTESNTAPLANDQIASGSAFIEGDQVKSDALTMADELMESDKPFIANETESNTTPLPVVETVYESTNISVDAYQNDSKQMGSDTISMADELKASDTTSIVDEQTDSDIVGEQPKLPTTSSADEQTECGIAHTKDKSDTNLDTVNKAEFTLAPNSYVQMESNSSPFKDEPTKSFLSATTNEQIGSDKTSNANESVMAHSSDKHMNPDTTDIAISDKDVKSVAAPFSEKQMESCSSPCLDKQNESDTTPLADDRIGSSTAFIEGDQVKSDALTMADELMESDKPFIANETESDTAAVVNEQTESNTTPLPVVETVYESTNFSADSYKNDSRQMRSDTVSIADELKASDTASIVDEQTDSDIVGEQPKLPTTSSADEQTECGIACIEDKSDTNLDEVKKTEFAMAPNSYVQTESNSSPFRDEPTESYSSAPANEQIGSDTTSNAIESVIAHSADEHMKPDTTDGAITDRDTKSVAAPFSEEQMESCRSPGIDEQICNPSLQTDSQTDSDALLMIDELEHSDAKPKTEEIGESRSMIEQSHVSNEPLAEQSEDHTTDKLAKVESQTESNDDTMSTNEEWQVDGVAKEMKEILEDRMAKDWSTEESMISDGSHEPLVASNEGIVLESAQFEDDEDDLAIVVQEQRSIRQVAASQIVDSLLEEPTREMCNAKDTNSNIDKNKENQGSVIRMDLQGGTAIIDHIPNFRKMGHEDVNSAGTPSMKYYHKFKRPSSECQSDMSKKRPRHEGSGEASEAVSGVQSGMQDMDQSTCDMVPITLPSSKIQITKISRVQAVKALPKFVKIVTGRAHKSPPVSIQPASSGSSPASMKSVSFAPSQMVRPQASDSTAPLASARFDAPPKSVGCVPSVSTVCVPSPASVSCGLNASTQMVAPMTSISSVPIASTQTMPLLTSRSRVPLASAQLVPPQTSMSSVPVTSTQTLPPLTNIRRVPLVPTQLVAPQTSISSVPIASTQTMPSLTNISSVPLAPTRLVPPQTIENPAPIPSVRLVLPPTCGKAVPMAPVQLIPPLASVSTLPVVSTGLISAPLPYTYSTLDVPAATPGGPTQPMTRFQVAPIMENQAQTITNPPHCAGILHLQYNQFPTYDSQGDQVITPAFTYFQHCQGNEGQQCIQQASATKPNFPSTFLNPQSSVQNAFSHYKQMANSTILTNTSKLTITNSQNTSGQVTGHASHEGYKTRAPVTVQHSSQPSTNAANSTGSYTSANSMNTTQTYQQRPLKFEFTSVRIAVPTTMPAWVLVNPPNLTTSTFSHSTVTMSSRSLLTTSSQSLHPQVESQTPREVSCAATAQVDSQVSLLDSQKSPAIVEQANINERGVKRTYEDVVGEQKKRPRAMAHKEMPVERLQKVSAHRLHVILELLQFATSYRFGSLYNPAVRDLTPDEVHVFGVLFVAVYGYRIYSEIQIKRIINEVAALTVHEIGAEEPRRVQEAVNSFSDVGLAKSEKLNRLSQILFTDYERAFCSATGKPGFAPFCKSRLFVLKHAYLHTIGVSASDHMVEEERMKHVLDSTANLLRIQMTQEGGYTDPQRVRDWMSKEQERVRTMLCEQQKELAEQRKLARKASLSRNYLTESQLGCYVMTASEHRMLEDIRDTGTQSPTRKEKLEHLVEAILSPGELLLLAKKAAIPESSTVCVKLGFLRQAFFTTGCGESNRVTSPVAKLKGVKEWLSGCILLIEVLDRIETQSATLRCLLLPTEVRVKSRRQRNDLKVNVKHGNLTTKRECKQEHIRSAQGTGKSGDFINMLPPNLGAYVMSKVIAVHLDVVKEIADRNKRESILQHILNKIITEDRNSQNQTSHTKGVQMYLAFLRQCIFLVFPQDTHEVQCEIWKRSTRYMASVLGSSVDELSPSGILSMEQKTHVSTVTVKKEIVEQRAYSFLGCPCCKEELGAMVLSADDVSEIRHIRDNIQGSSNSRAREVAVKELVMKLLSQEDMSSVPICLALRKLPLDITKLTKLRLSYFYLFPPSSLEEEGREWAHCWSFLTQSLQDMMQNNRGFIEMISVPRTVSRRMNMAEQHGTDYSDDDRSQYGALSNSSDSSSSGDERAEADVDMPLFIRTGAVMNDYPKRWIWEKRHTNRLPPSTRVAETELGRKVPLPLGTPMTSDKIGCHVMTLEEENWKKDLKRTCHAEMLTKEQVVQRIVRELYTQDDIIYIHNLKRNKKSAFCPLKMAILRQVYFELFDEGIMDPFQLWSQCWAHLAHVVDKIRQKARNALLDKVVLTDKYKRLKKLQLRKAKLLQRYEKRPMKRTCDSQQQAGQPKTSKAKTDDMNINISPDHSVKTSNVDFSTKDEMPFFVNSGAVHVRPCERAYLNNAEEYAHSYTVIAEKEETARSIFGKPVDETKLGAHVMTKEEAHWTQTLKDACHEKNISKGNVVEFITQNVYIVPEIRRFPEVKRQKQVVFNKLKIAVIRQVYYSVYPPASNEKASEPWLKFWAYFTKACLNLGKNGRTLPSLISKLHSGQRAKATGEKHVQLALAKPKKSNQSGNGNTTGKAGEPDPKVDVKGKLPESQFTLRPHFLRLLQCYSWNPDILVRFMAANIFTEEELLGCGGKLKALHPLKMKEFETAFSQFYDPANSAASISLIKHIQDLKRATSSDYWGRLTPAKVQVEVEKCANLCKYTCSAGETGQEQHQTFSMAERSKMCRDLLDEDFKNLPQYKFERCVHVACKLIEKMFSREELLTGNTAGTRGLCTLDPKRIAVLKYTTFAIACVAPSAHQRTWDRIHLDVDQALKSKGTAFLTEDRRVEKELECSTVLIGSKSRSLSQKQESETGFQMISCTSLIPSVLRRDLLLCAEDHTEVLTKLMNHFMHKDEDYDQFLFRAPSKMKLVRAVYWSICSISIDKLGDSWIEALKTISHLVENGKLYEKSTNSNDEMEESAASLESGDKSTKMAEESNQFRDTSTQQEGESKPRQQGSQGDVKDSSIHLMKCYKWSKEVVVRLLIQLFLTESEFDKVAQNKKMNEKKMRVIEDAFFQVYGEEEKDQCKKLIKQIIEDVRKESRSSFCSVWARKSKQTAVEEAARATSYGKARSGPRRSEDLDCEAFIQEEFPWLPSGEVGKCLFISVHMRKCFFSTEELAFGSCSGTTGWPRLDPKRMDVLKHVVFAVAAVPEHKKETLWQLCSKAIDRKNRELRRQLLEEDEKVERLIQTNPKALEEQIPDDVRSHVMQSKDNAVTVIRSLVQQLFNPEDLMGDADEMTPSQMKLLQEFFFKIHEVAPTEKEEAWIQALRTINYLNKISGYTFKSGEDWDSSSFLSDKDEGWTEGMNDYPGGESSDEDMTHETQDVRSIPSKEETPSEPITGKDMTHETQDVRSIPSKEETPSEPITVKDMTHETQDVQSIPSKEKTPSEPFTVKDTPYETRSKSKGQDASSTESAPSRNSEMGVGQHSVPCSSDENVDKGSGITEESLDWYILKPVLVQLYNHLKAYKLEEDEIIDELIMHIFGAKLLDGESAALSLDESIEMLKSAFFVLYNVPGNEQAAANDLLEERLMHTLMILGQHLTQNMDEKLVVDETTVNVLNKPKPYPPLSDLEEKVKKMRSLMMESFRADERVEMDNAKLKKLKGSKVDAVIHAFQKSFPSSETMERKTVMTLIYNLTVELQELVTEKLRFKVDSLTDAYVQRAVSALEAKAMEQASTGSSATPLFQAVIQELAGVQRAVGLVPMVRVLLGYLFTPEELVLLQQADMTQPPSLLQFQMNLMQRTVFKVMKIPSSERENAWSCIQWIIAKEISELKSVNEESNKKKIRSEMFVPVYNRCAVMKCVMGIVLSLEEQSQFHADPQRFEMNHPEKIKEMKNLYFQIRNIQEHAKDEEWELVCTPKKNYEVAKQLTFPNRRSIGRKQAKKTVTSPAPEEKSELKPCGGRKKTVQEPKNEQEQIQKPKKKAAVMCTEGDRPEDIEQSQMTTRSKAKEASKKYISIRGGKKGKSPQQKQDQRTISTQPPSSSPKPPVAVQHKKTIVVLVDYSICDRVCKIMADEESKKNENVRANHDKEKECATDSNSGSPITNTSQKQDGAVDTQVKVDRSINYSNDENYDRVVSNSSEKNSLETEETSSVSPVAQSQEENGSEQELSVMDSAASETNLTGSITSNTLDEDADTRRSKDVDQIEVAASLLKSAVENLPSNIENDEAHHSQEDSDILCQIVVKDGCSALAEGKTRSNKLNFLSPNAESAVASPGNDVSVQDNVDHSRGSDDDPMETEAILASHIEPNDSDILGNGNEDDAFSEVDDNLLGDESDKELQIDEGSEPCTASLNDQLVSEQSLPDSEKDADVEDVGHTKQHSETEGIAQASNTLCQSSADNPSRDEPASSKTSENVSNYPTSDGNINKNSSDCPTDNSKEASDDVMDKEDATDVDNRSSANVVSAQMLSEEVLSQGSEGDGKHETKVTDNPESKGSQKSLNSNLDILLWAAEVENKHEENSDVGNTVTTESPSNDSPLMQGKSKGHEHSQSDSNSDSNLDILQWAAQVKGSTDFTK